jgi:hypothetical protein
MPDAPASPSGASRPGPAGIVDDAEPMSFGRRSGRILALVVAVAIAGLWAYALWGPTKKDPPGLLSDTTYATQFESICTDTAAQIAALPPAYATREAGARAEVIEEANGYLDTMILRLRQVAPTAEVGDDGRMIQEWLGDWQTYLGDRQNYVAALADDPQARFLVSEKDKRQITEPIDFFAKYNEMENCMTPGDLA